MWADYQSQQWKYLFEITRAIAARLDLETVLDRALRYAVDLVGGQAGLIALREGDAAFRFVARVGIDPRLLPRFEPLIRDLPFDIERDRNAHHRFPELELSLPGIPAETALVLQHAVTIPLVASGPMVGIVYVFRPPQVAALVTLDEEALAVFADHVAIAIEHARLYHDAMQRAREVDAVIEGSAHGILITDEGGAIRRINRALERLTGWTRDQAAGQDYSRVLQITDERGAARPIAAPGDGQQPPPPADGFLVRRDGTRGAYVHVNLSPLVDEAQQLFSIVGNVVDLTTYREADQLKTTFLAGISHDLKTPLALIRGYAETLRRTDVTWDRQTVDDSLAIIEDETEHLTNLVNALLDAAQLERGRLPLHTIPTRLDELALKMVERFQAVDSQHVWKTEFPENFPVVPTDAERIREVLQNLLGNAAKYSPRGTTITVGGWAEPERVGLLVRDQGPGISIEEQARLFERFTRGRGSQAQRTQGAGLGLYLCRAIVEQHGGKIWMENLAERGAAFYLTLPRTMTLPTG